MSKIINLIMEIIKIAGNLKLDIGTTTDGKIRICIEVDPKDLMK